MPSVQISINCFVIGNISPSKDKELYDFYELTIPYDSNEIYIDWQADFPDLFIYFGDKQATKNNYHFYFNSIGHDTVYKITKEEIIKNKNINLINENSLKDLKINIGIQTNNADTLYTSVYALRVFVPLIFKENENLEVLHIKGDQKMQCRPQSKGNILFCYFAVIFDKGDFYGDLTVYMQSQSKNSIIYYYANLVDSEEVEKNDINYLAENIPKLNNSTYNYETSKLPYIYIREIPDGKSLLINIETKTNDIIEIFSSIYHGNKMAIPNPSTPQLFSINANTNLSLDFSSSSPLLINIQSIWGGGEIFWEHEMENIYYLHGENDKLSLPSGKEILYKLIFRANQNNYSDQNNLPGFIFLLTFYPRNNFNFDQIKIGSSVEFNYNNCHFPLNYFTKISYYENITISFNFYYLQNEDDSEFNYDNEQFAIWGKIISEEEALELRLNEKSRPNKDDNSMIGYFSYPLGSLFIDKNEIEKFYNENKKEPYLFFTIENKFYLSYDNVGLELSALLNKELENEYVFAPEKVYVNGQNEMSYKLRVNKNRPYIRIEFSCNSECIDFFNKGYDQSHKSIEPIQQEDNINGRAIITFEIQNLEKTDYLYFIIFRHKEKKCLDPKLNHYIFKYMTAETIDQFFDFNIKDDYLNIQIKEKADNYKDYLVNFNSISCTNCEISYLIKFISSNKFNPEENINTIAISEAEDNVYELQDPETNSDNTISFSMFNIPDDISVIKVIAKVKQQAITEFVLYKPYLIMIEGNDKLMSLTYDYNISKVSLLVKKAFKKQKFLLLFKESEKNPNYIKVETISKNNSNQILYFSTTDPEGNENRDQISFEQISNTSYMWIKKEQYQNSKFYLIVECREESCDYDLNIYGLEIIEINDINFEFSYYVGNNNKEMKFRIKNNILDNDNIKSIEFYGFNVDKLSINLNNKNLCNSFGCISKIIKNSNFKDDYYLNVESNEGKYVHIGGKTISEDSYSNQIIGINSYGILGLLANNIYNNKSDCYLLPENKNIGFYLTLILKKKPIKIYFLDQNNLKSEYSQIIDEYYFEQYYSNINQYKYICLIIPEITESGIDISYILHLSDQIQDRNLSSQYFPKLNGQFYSQIIPKGAMIYLPGISNFSWQNINYYLQGTEGYSKMYIFKCTTFPVCEFDDMESSNQLIIPDNEINMVSNWKSKEKIISPIAPTQYIMGVKCENIEKSKTDFCKFKTLIYSSEYFIELIERLPFSSYLLENEKNNFKIDISFEENIFKIFIDLTVISGDIFIEVEKEQSIINLSMSKYYLGNKIYYSLTIGSKKINNIYISVNAKINSYYIINYQLVLYDSENTDNYLYSGNDYVVSLGKISTKNVYIYKHKLLESSSYFININSFNCKIKVDKYKNNSLIKAIKPIRQYYYQDNIKDSDDEEIDQNNQNIDFHYNISIKSGDSSNYDNNKCLLLVNNIEIINENINIERGLVLNENYPNKIIFNSFKKIRYLFPHSDSSKDLEIFIQNYDYAKYSLNIIYNHKEKGGIYEFNGNYYLFIGKKQLEGNCQKNKLCKIIIEINLLNNDSITIEKSPMIEILIRRAENVPYYLPKGIVRNDFIRKAQKLYLYTEYKGENGYILVNFLRGQGKIYGKVIGSPKNAIWQGHKFPDNEDESNNFKYDYYTKKLIINPDLIDIECDKNCLILLTIQSTVIGDGNDDEIYPISIFVNDNTKNPKKITKIKLELDQYIVGSIPLNDNNNQRLYEYYEYYEVTITNDTETVQIELQSDIFDLYINLGEELPTKKKYHFYFESKWEDNIYEISRDEIIQKIKKDFTENLNLVIGIYSNIHSIYRKNTYSLKVNTKQIDKENIIKIRGDKKTLCIPKKLENNYRCLFMILLEQDDYKNNLIIHAKSQSQTNSIKIFADYIDYEIYKNDNNELYNHIPNSINISSNSITKKDNFIYFNSLKKDRYLFVNVISDKSDIIELLTSLSTHDKELIPNLDLMYIFALKNEEIIFSFINKRNIVINIVSLNGEAQIFWDGESDSKYSLRGTDDILTLTSNYNNNHKLIVKNINYKNDSNNSKFVFYIQYHDNSRIIEIYSGKTFEFSNSGEDFPLYFYYKIGEIKYDINIFIIFHEIKEENESYNKTIISEFKTSTNLSNHLLLYNQGRIEDKLNFQSNGINDPSLRVSQVFLTKEEIQNYNLNQSGIPTLFLGILKSRNNYKCKGVSMEISIIKENSDEFITEKIYQFGKITNETRSYKLKLDNSTDSMRIHFSTNSKNIDLSINTQKNSRINETNIKFETKSERGKLFITFKKPLNNDFIYLNIFLKNENSNNQCNNYVFKYINTDHDQFIEYPIFKNEDEIEFKIQKNQDNKEEEIVFKFNKIENKENKNLDITYSIKIISSKYFVNDEIINTIAITESKGIVSQVKNPKDKDGIISLSTRKYSEIKCFEVIAKIKDGPITEYVAYKPNYLEENDENKKMYYGLIFVIGFAALIIITIIFSLYLCLKCKFTKFKEDINKISYQVSRSEENQDGDNLEEYLSTKSLEIN